MYLRKYHFVFLTLFSLIFCVKDVFAIDTIKMNIGRPFKDERQQYNQEVLHTALKLTIPEFGEYKFAPFSSSIPLSRLRTIINKGEIANLAIAVTTPEWEELTTPIRIPIRRGILNYRLLMTTKEKLKEFENVNTLEQIKEKWACVGRQWSTTRTLIALDFNINNAFEDNSILKMLSKERCDYVPRGVHEIYMELDKRKKNMPNLVAEPNIALFMPSPFYIFVSPNEPRLIKRLTLGLEKMVEQGILEEMVNKYYGHYLKQAKLSERKLINVGNPVLPKETPLNRKELWLNN